jgi:TonB-linked SusC/RagA family outer membrane protein
MIIRKVYNNLKRTMLLLLWLACSHAVLAQERVVSGSVKDQNGTGLAGVSVVVKNTTTGTNTGMDGKFSISAAPNATLVFSFIGYTSKEVAVGNQSVVDVVLAEETQQLGEVVVTALGVERSQKALQSAVTKVPGVSLTQARENNFGAAIQGRVAGVNVSKPSTGAAGSSRVIIRGNKSLKGDNQPLYVIDGIPMDNTQFGNAGVWGGSDQGDGLSALNPDDIESITVLKGANAAALYGSRGGYGVINITTKKGNARKGIGVEFNSNYVFEKVINYLDLQTEYGQGDLANSNPNDPSSIKVGSKPVSQRQAFDIGQSSWGAKLDGSNNIMWDGVSRPYSLIGAQHNYDAFFNTGSSWTNSIAFTGGSDKQTFRFSFSDLKNSSVIPESGFNRKNMSLSTNGKYGKRVTFDAKVMYSNEDAKNRPMVSDSPGNAVQTVMLLPPNYDVNDYKGDPNKLGAVPADMTTPDNKGAGEELQNSGNLWSQNPWWAAYQYVHTNVTDRFITSGRLRFDITNWLYIQGRVGMDYYTRKYKELVPQGTGYQRGGSATEQTTQVREINQEWTLGADKAFGKLNVNAFVGGNKMTNKSETVADYGSDFNVPFFASVSNGKNQSIGWGYSARGINSLFGSAEISYGGYLYLTGTARNDWFSVLNPKNNSKLYPSVGASFVVTDAFKNLPKVISFGKVRAAWGQVATANVNTYGLASTYSLFAQGHLGRPLGSFSNGDNIPNPNLVPALSTETEFGAEVKFLEDRVGLDITYYNQKTTDDILDGTVSIASGFASTSMNIGQLTNKGIELLITATPVKGQFTWDVSLNLAKNKNKVVELSGGATELILEEPRTRSVYIKHIVGHPFGMITGWTQAKDEAGNRKYSATGEVIASSEYNILGNGVANLTGGLNNSFTYKRFNLSFLIDFKSGGDIYSGTNVRLLQAGLSKESLIGRDGTMQITGVFQDGTTNTDGTPHYTGVETRTLTAEQAENYWGSVGSWDESHFVYDATFVKLRQVTFGYDLPAKLLSKTPVKSITLSFVARNLACLLKHTPNIDPEASYSSSNSQGLDYFGLPSTRSFGFNLKATF